MAPTVGRHADGSALAIGSPGADRITTAVVQALAGFVGGLGLARRCTTRGCTCTGRGVRTRWSARESELSMYFGGVGAALTRPDGHLVAAADPRRDGAVRLVHPGRP